MNIVIFYFLKYTNTKKYIRSPDLFMLIPAEFHLLVFNILSFPLTLPYNNQCFILCFNDSYLKCISYTYKWNTNFLSNNHLEMAISNFPSISLAISIY